MAQLNLGRVKGLDGAKGDKGEKGDTPVVSATATVNNTTGIPSVSVSKTATADGAMFNFTFNNVKGDKGEKGESPLAFSFENGVLTIVER